MARNRKYDTVEGYWVYTIQVPSINKFYVGVSKTQCCKRWCKTYYKNTALEPYIDEWDSMIKTVIKDGLTREESLIMEDALIQELNKKGLCINFNRSGLIRVSDINAYNKEYYENNSEYRERAKQRNKQYYENNKKKINEHRRKYMRQYRLKNKQQQNNILNIKIQ